MSASSGRDFDVVIVGGGVIGAAMASLLVARKLSAPGRVAIIAERFSAGPPAHADWDLRVFALSRASQRLLQACGVWDALPAQRLFAYERMCVWDAGGEPHGKGSLSFDCAEIGEPNLGFIVDGGALQWQCVQAARRAGAVMIEAGLERLVAADADISMRWWGTCARASLTTTPRGSDFSRKGPWPSFRCRTAAHPSSGAPRWPRRLVWASWIPRASPPP
jgi:2-octaprenylphenol hydroxylase